MDAVAKGLPAVITELEAQGMRYTVTVTFPSRKTFRLEEQLYVVRQLVDDDGVCNIVVAAKMGKEVS
jgi:hypothetical protein